MTVRDEATLSQIRAADPTQSVWLSANAGSGKTRVLTDRVARLLLGGVPPQNILCLTYTKAAASEMQNRLFQRLGAWAMLPEAKLIAALDELGADRQTSVSDARTLFARAIETPGGLKIQTIHSFCAALLRRFPLEAGLSPQFQEMDESAQRHLIADVLETVALGDEEGALSTLAQFFSGDDLVPLAAEVAGKRHAFDTPLSVANAARCYGLPAGFGEDTLAQGLLAAEPARAIAAGISALHTGSARDQGAADKLEAIDLAQPAPSVIAALEPIFLFGSGARQHQARLDALPTKATREAHPEATVALHTLMEAIETLRPKRIALAAAQRTGALHRFAAVFLAEYAAEKQRRGWLDFDDLVLRSVALLSQSEAADWVRFRLDGRIDHVLVDEAQDTSLLQWRLVELLTEEFGAGEGARGDARRLFVVGDKKQSIYSFQGADAQAFDAMEDRFRGRLQAAGGMQSRSLDFSFRSAQAILDTVDATFEDAAGIGAGSRHRAFFAEMPGRVDLWPLIPKAEAPEEGDWTDPVDRPAANHEAITLADGIAGEIRRLVDDPTAVLPRAKGPPRRITEGDFLILVQGRSGSGDMFRAIIRACKAHGLAVAGADRLKIAGELAVRDLRALLAFLALPEDSLSLAAALRSPLFGWSEQALFTLAAHRESTYLWPALRGAAQAHPDTLVILEDLRREADFLRPFDLLERILIRHQGRARLLAQLGPEAEDGIDELLTQALTYEQQDVPSLTGFLAWLDGEDVEVKRQLDSAGGRIRVMTVHGAKGLESPVVILPDTLRGPRAGRNNVILDDTGHAHWRTLKDETPELLRTASEAVAEADRLERERLLYVAMTRAENWLIVCGAGTSGKGGGTWYDAVAAGLERTGSGPVPTPAGQGKRHFTGAWPETAEPSQEPTETPFPELLPSASAHAPVPNDAPTPLAPSDLGGEKALPGEPAVGDALRHGRLVHRLLEHLPGIPGPKRRAFAEQILATGDDIADPGESSQILAEVGPLLEHPDLAHVFGAGALAEVEITAEIDALGGHRIRGAIDRLIVEPNRITAIDFKTNSVVPQAPGEVPEGLLRQMGAYAAALEQVYPGREIGTAILWTRAPALMHLPHDIVMAALARAAIS
ncbi:MAG: double-strand break repair helicase AddA [Pseudomonadota bacterium]